MKPCQTSNPNYFVLVMNFGLACFSSVMTTLLLETYGNVMQICGILYTHYVWGFTKFHSKYEWYFGLWLEWEKGLNITKCIRWAYYCLKLQPISQWHRHWDYYFYFYFCLIFAILWSFWRRDQKKKKHAFLM